MYTLKDAVKNWLGDFNPTEREGALEDLLQYGCESGIVGELIYYSDTTAFFEQHCKEISTLLAEMLDNTGYTSPANLFGDKWDADDPLALDIQNQNLLAWFGFEEAARKIATSIISEEEKNHENHKRNQLLTIPALEWCSGYTQPNSGGWQKG